MSHNFVEQVVVHFDRIGDRSVEGKQCIQACLLVETDGDHW